MISSTYHMKLIPIGCYKNCRDRGKFAIVDDCDYAWLVQFSWYLACGYPTTSFTYKGRRRLKIHMHNLLLHFERGKEVDHINRNKLDNRRENLRFATHSQNVKNVQRKDCKSGLRGVCWTGQLKKRPWYATAHFQGRQFNLGRYATKEEAAAAYAAFQHRIETAPHTIKMPRRQHAR